MPLVQLLKPLGGKPRGSVINVTPGAAKHLEGIAAAFTLEPEPSDMMETNDAD